MGALKVFIIAEPVIIELSLFDKPEIVMARLCFDNTNSPNGRMITCSIKKENAIYISNIDAYNSDLERKQLLNYSIFVE